MAAPVLLHAGRSRGARAARARLHALSLAAAVALSGCGDPLSAWLTDDCKDEMNRTRDAFGEPQRITDAPHDGDWGLETWWYTSIGFSRSFEWGRAYRDCRTTDTSLKPGV